MANAHTQKPNRSFFIPIKHPRAPLSITTLHALYPPRDETTNPLETSLHDIHLSPTPRIMSQAPRVTAANYRTFKEYPKVVDATARILARQPFVAPVGLLVEMSLLDPKDLARWKGGQVSCLERLIRCNLTRAGRILRLLRCHAHDLNLKPSLTAYRHKGQTLRFSRSGDPGVEEAYARHFVMVGKNNEPARESSH